MYGPNDNFVDQEHKNPPKQPRYQDPTELREAYQDADGVLKETARRFDASYGTVRHWLIEYGIHEPDEGRTTLADRLEDPDVQDVEDLATDGGHRLDVETRSDDELGTALVSGGWYTVLVSVDADKFDGDAVAAALRESERELRPALPSGQLEERPATERSPEVRSGD